jgi:peroxiredoxin
LYEQLKIDLGALYGSEEWQLPVPATYVVDRNANIVLASIDADYTTRLEPAQALAALKSFKN